MNNIAFCPRRRPRTRNRKLEPPNTHNTQLATSNTKHQTLNTKYRRNENGNNNGSLGK